MGDTRLIDQSWLDNAASVIRDTASATESTRGMVSVVSNKARSLGADIQTIYNEFKDFREYDEEQKELARAKTQIVHVHQQVKEKFGANDDVRQYLTGILEASDLSLVKQRVLSREVEKLMISCPTYWLAPCLVAISAWLDDNKALATRAIQEAIKRDDEKTSLLMALVCRRIGRMNASGIWLERYLAVQDPSCMERKMTTVLDAYSSGLFGGAAREACATRIDSWLTELRERPGFVEQQQDSWETAMFSMVDGNYFDGKYPYSAKRVTNWDVCTAAMNEAGLHDKLLNYFKGIFEKPISTTASLEQKLDDLLEVYISSYDDEELPLRREERYLELMIEERGRRSRVETRYASEQKALEETFDFTQLLTNAAMHADVIKASISTQRLAIALSKDWVTSAFNNIAVKVRNHIPQSFRIDIEGWNQTITDGSEQASLCQEAEKEFSARRDREIAAVVQSKWDLIIPIILAVAMIPGFISGPMWGFICVIAAAGFGLRWFMNKKNCENTKKSIFDKYTDIIKNVKDTVMALCAERVDYIAEISARDAVSQQTSEYLDAIEVGQYVASSSQRNMMV